MKNDTESMTVDVFHAYLREAADHQEIENKPLLVNGRKVVEAVLRQETVVGRYSTATHNVVELTTHEHRHALTAAQVDEFFDEFSDEVNELRLIVDGFELWYATVEEAGVVLHQMPCPPKPMTGTILKGYLASIIDQYPAVEDELVLIDSPSKHIVDRSINDYGLRNGHVVLGNSTKPIRMSLTAHNLHRYLGMASGGMLSRVMDNPVMIGNQEVVNATVVDNQVILMTFNDLLESDDFFRR